MAEQRDFYAPHLNDRVGQDNQWIQLREKISWERFRKILSETNRTGESGGRPPYDPVSMFRAVLLGQWHDMSDEELEQALRVRLDFIVFCGFALSGDVPDRSTIQGFRAKLQEKERLPRCLRLLNQELERVGIKVKSGKLILDSTIIESAARPRNVVTPSDDNDEPPTITTSCDPDAAWTVKGNHNYYGYKEHTVVEAGQGFIEDLTITPANVHDGKMLEPMLKGRRGVVETLADKAYASKDNREYLKDREIKDSILIKAARNRPLTEREKKHNRRRISARRFTVKQQCGTKKRKFGFSRARYIGIMRVSGQAILKAICCNLLKAFRMFASPSPCAA